MKIIKEFKKYNESRKLKKRYPTFELYCKKLCGEKFSKFDEWDSYQSLFRIGEESYEFNLYGNLVDWRMSLALKKLIEVENLLTDYGKDSKTEVCLDKSIERLLNHPTVL